MKKIQLQLFFGFISISSLLILILHFSTKIYNLLEDEYNMINSTPSNNGSDLIMFMIFTFIGSIIGLTLVTFINIEDKKSNLN